jgi:hypothetical protein
MTSDNIPNGFWGEFPLKVVLFQISFCFSCKVLSENTPKHLKLHGNVMCGTS